MPIIAVNSIAFSARPSVAADWYLRIVVSHATMPRACAKPISSRPPRSTGNGPPLAMVAIPRVRRIGDAASASVRWRATKSPTGTSITMRAKPKPAASAPSWTSDSPTTRSRSGSSAGNAPIGTVLVPTVRQTRAIRRARIRAV
jgi:hypothetical protein